MLLTLEVVSMFFTAVAMSLASRRSALRKLGSRSTRARIVSLKSRVKVTVVTSLLVFEAYSPPTESAPLQCHFAGVFSWHAASGRP